jgi:hypothetical protein
MVSANLNKFRNVKSSVVRGIIHDDVAAVHMVMPVQEYPDTTNEVEILPSDDTLFSLGIG